MGEQQRRSWELVMLLMLDLIADMRGKWRGHDSREWLDLLLSHLKKQIQYLHINTPFLFLQHPLTELKPNMSRLFSRRLILYLFYISARNISLNFPIFLFSNRAPNKCPSLNTTKSGFRVVPINTEKLEEWATLFACNEYNLNTIARSVFGQLWCKIW